MPNDKARKRAARRKSAANDVALPRRKAKMAPSDASSHAPAGSTHSFPIVALGASAGGIEAFEAFFRATPGNSGMAFVVLAHLDPERESMLPSLLSHWTDMPVAAARENGLVEANKVYVIPPNAVLTIAGRRLHIRKRSDGSDRMPIDAFFLSLAEDQGENAICVVLSGAGSDGSIGLKSVKEHGGLTLAQGSDGSEARFKEMPDGAVATGLVDLVVSVEDMPARLVDYVKRLPTRDFPSEATSERRAHAMRSIYSVLRGRIGHDFSRYKERTFLRRVERRMQVLQLATLEDYAERLRQDANEPGLLFRDLLIGVTNFFRDREAFASLEKHVPRLFEGKGANDFVRVWVIGCATGEEAYSIAILLREHADTLPGAPKIQIFATDIDEQALTTGRAGRYPSTLLRDVSPARLKRFFERDAGYYSVSKEIRDLCVFSSHSIIRDPPFSRLDLISCRNLLIYLNPELQTQVIPFFHYALRSGGLLFMGTSENVSRHGDLFAALDKKWRIFERQNLVARSEMPFPLLARLPGMGVSERRGLLIPTAGPGETGPSLPIVLRQIATQVQEEYGPAYVVANKEGEVIYYSGRTGRYLEPAEGPPNRDLAAMTRKGLRLDLRTALHEAKESGQAVRRDHVMVQINGGSQAISLAVQPISEGSETLYLVVFNDIGPMTGHEAPKPPGPPASDTEATVLQLERDLQTTKERLQTTIEEFDTSSEELKSSNEELLSVNEELQSANEELETSKEEIQSINEELQTVNAELSSKIEELDRTNADLKNLFESTQIATIILDHDLLIRTFTPAVERIFNLRPGDRGRPLTDIVSKLDEPTLRRDIRIAVERGQEMERRVTAEQGSVHYLMRVLPYRAPDKKIDGALITFVEVTNFVRAEQHEKRLSSELSHRVKSNLGSAIAIVTDTLKRAKTLDDFSEIALDRLDAMERVHELVAKRNWAKAPLRELVASELTAYLRAHRKNVSVDGPDTLIGPGAALAVGEALHELASNAVKHGALSVADGKVDLSWSVQKRSGPVVVLTWIERGGPPSAAPRDQRDLSVIQRGLRAELGSEAVLDFRRSGLRCTIRIPLPPQTNSSEAEE